MKCHAIIIALSLTLVGCGVSKDKYASLEDSLKESQSMLADANTARASCEKQLGQVSETKQSLEKKTATYADLVNSLESEIKAGKVKISEMKDRLTVNLIDKILFDSGKTSIKMEGQGALQKVAEVLKGIEGKRIQVEGHTDNVPLGAVLRTKFPTNWELSTTRATVVSRFLAESGVPESRLSATGYSMFAPVASNDTEEGRRQNRRIEIVLVPSLDRPAAAKSEKGK